MCFVKHRLQKKVARPSKRLEIYSIPLTCAWGKALECPVFLLFLRIEHSQAQNRYQGSTKRPVDSRADFIGRLISRNFRSLKASRPSSSHTAILIVRSNSMPIPDRPLPFQLSTLIQDDRRAAIPLNAMPPTCVHLTKCQLWPQTIVSTLS